VPGGFEWLAFELEHSEAFAVGQPPPKRPERPEQDPPEGLELRDLAGREQMRLQQGDCPLEIDDPPREFCQGYLQTYIATRDLNILYVDGTSAGKGIMGTMDMQDYVIRDQDDDDLNSDPRRRPMMGDLVRAEDLCRFAKEHRVDGIVRMEIGFEIIYCDFNDGLEQVSALRQLLIRNVSGIKNFLNLYEWARAAAGRYDDIGGNRVLLDFSSMTSAWFYRVNLTNPDPKRPDLPRLSGLSREERGVLREDIRKMASRQGKGIDWQRNVADMIVNRFSHRLATLTREECGIDEFVSQIIIGTNVHVMAPTMTDRATPSDGFDREGMEMCSAFYLRPATLLKDQWAEQDELIYTAVSTVTSTICEAFFRIRQLVLEIEPLLAVTPYLVTSVSSHKLNKAVQEGKGILLELKKKLQWATWKKCEGCAVDEICFVAMYPFGREEDHFSPGCLNWTVLAGANDSVFYRRGYWF